MRLGILAIHHTTASAANSQADVEFYADPYEAEPRSHIESGS